MKTKIFSDAIFNHSCIRFLFGLEEVILVPYLVSFDSEGRKTLFGRTLCTGEVRSFPYSRIANIRILQNEMNSRAAIAAVPQMSVN